MITYRKTKDDKWVAFGPVAEVKPGLVTVTKKDGLTKQETVTGLGKPFDVNGTAHVYGYLRPTPRSGNSGGGETKTCWECGSTFTYAQCRASDGEWGDSYCGC